MNRPVNQNKRALADVTQAYSAFKPPRRVPVSQSAAESLYFKQPGGVPGLWNPSETPYMIEPMDMLASRRHEAVCFVGPARTGKTAGLLLGWLTHAVVSDPGDMLFVQMNQEKAREFSKTDVDRAIRHSPDIRGLMGGSQDDNTHDKTFRHGMWLRIAWPTVSNVSGSTYRYVAITDIDRMQNAENVDGEGPLFMLALKRTTTYMSRGMCLVESSPGHELTDPHWQARTPHEAPPAKGVLGIYNRSDRRRFYWPCEHCHRYFEASPGLSLFGLPSEDSLLEIVREADLESIAVEHNRIICPHCKGKIGPRAKHSMNQRGRWLQDGLTIRPDGTVEGVAHSSTIAGYWLGGVAAAYQSWRSILLRYLQGLRDYTLTSSEESIKATVNTDQGMPYLSRHLRQAASAASDPASRREASMERYIVPPTARFLVATVDVQGGVGARFIVQVHAIGPHREKWLIDRYAITESAREGLGGKAPIDPAGYAEDWDAITERVVRSTYRTGNEGVEMRVRLTVVDTGGEDGVTERAYAWYRRLAKQNIGMRVMLVKGQSSRKFEQSTPNIRLSRVGGRNSKEEGDIPLYLLNVDRLKDIVASDLRRTIPGPGYIHIPQWLPQSFLDELNSEVRNEDGTWTQVRKRNEAFDLLAYAEAGMLCLGADKINWDNPPDWAKTIESNIDKITRTERREMQDNTPIAQAPVTPEPAPVSRVVGRRVARSSYMT